MTSPASLTPLQKEESPVKSLPSEPVVRRLDFKRDLQDVPGTILAAIQQANYAQNGAQFGDFMVKAATDADFRNIWESDGGHTPIAFYAFQGKRADGYLALGDVAIVQPSGASVIPPFNQVGTLLFNKADPSSDVLKNPTGFEWILDDRGSGNSKDISYWRPIPPAGYIALGVCFGNGSAQPDPAKYWCVKMASLRKAKPIDYWSDRGQGWAHHSGDLQTPALDTSSGPPSRDEMLIVPPTFLSVEGNQSPYVIVAKKLFMDIQPVNVDEPTFNPNAGSGSVSPLGLQKIAVLPFTTVPDPGFLSKPEASPFYYLANEPYWICNGSQSTPEGGQIETSVKVGVSTSESESFSNTTAFSIGVNVGIAAGDTGGFTGGVSVSYTSEMNVTTEKTTQNVTETTDTLTLNIPKQPVTQFWQRVQRLVMYRTNGSSISAADYGTHDNRFVPNGTVTLVR